MARRRSRSVRSLPPGADPLRLRARRLRRRGEYRKAAIALRQLVFRGPTAALWVQLGYVLAKAGRTAQAVDALKQGRWLHQRGAATRKAATVDRLLDGLAVPNVAAA